MDFLSPRHDSSCASSDADWDRSSRRKSDNQVSPNAVGRKISIAVNSPSAIPTGSCCLLPSDKPETCYELLFSASRYAAVLALSRVFSPQYGFHLLRIFEKASLAGWQINIPVSLVPIYGISSHRSVQMRLLADATEGRRLHSRSLKRKRKSLNACPLQRSRQHYPFLLHST